MAVPSRPRLDTLKKRLGEYRRGGRRLRRDGFLRETYVLPRAEARQKAREWYEKWPKQAYWTSVESWSERPDDMIEFTMRRLPSAD
jgi:hypothetical protein